MKNTSYQDNGEISFKLTMKIHEYIVANLVPVAVPDICCLTILLNSKLLCCNTKRAILIRYSVLKELFSLLSKTSFKAFILPHGGY